MEKGLLATEIQFEMETGVGRGLEYIFSRHEKSRLLLARTLCPYFRINNF